MKAAIYSRKSKFTGKGDSVENQVQLCREYGEKLSYSEFEVYEDEGFSGKNIHRPGFQSMLQDAKSKKFDVIICYRLDRISRNVSDFAQLIDELQSYGIGFISIRDQFDTTTPMGRAMMYIASVFAQLERETIAERIRDNMLELAKSGRWLGGQTPLGFESELISYYDAEMKERKLFKLSPVAQELETVKLIFDKYLEYKSISQVNKYLLQNSIPKKNGGSIWQKRGVSDILTNPVYVKANNEIFDYLAGLGIAVVGNPNGKHGLLTYNKKNGVKNFRAINEWIAAVAKHDGIIEPSTWLEVQNLLKINKSKAPRLGKTNNAILTGLLKCAKCGSQMKVIQGKSADNSKVFYYKCTLKEASGNVRCDNLNIKANEIESVVIKYLEKVTSNEGLLFDEINKYQNTLAIAADKSYQIENFKRNIKEKEAMIQNLVMQLARDPNVADFIIPQIHTLGDELTEIKAALADIENQTIEINKVEINAEILKEVFSKIAIIDTFPIDQKKLLLNSVVDAIYWDGDTGEIDIKLWGTQKKKIQSIKSFFGEKSRFGTPSRCLVHC